MKQENAKVYYFEDPLKKEYEVILENAFVATLIILLILFITWQRFSPAFTFTEENNNWIVDVVDIPITKQLKQPPPPEIPSVPVPEEDLELVEELTISWDDIDIKELTETLPPQDEEPEIVPFEKLAFRPEVIKSVAPVYPAMARAAGVEGTVVLKVLIDQKGRIEKVEVLKSIPMLDDAAIEAVKGFKFSPGRQRDRYVKVWMSIPFHFRLK